MAGNEIVVAHIASIDETNWDAGHELQIATSHDRGATWSKASITLPIATENPPSVSLSGTAVGILVPWGTSQNFSVGQFIFSADERDWALRDAPVAGNVAVIAPNEVWLAGGVLNEKLFRTVDGGASWEPAILPGLTAPFSVDSPVAVGDRGRQLIVTVPGDKTTVVLMTSQDAGSTWTRASSVQVAGVSGAGVSVAAAIDEGQWRVANWGDPTVITSLSPFPSSEIAGSLPGVITNWSVATKGLGWATVFVANCPTKLDCTTSQVLMRTRDDGARWEPLGG